MAVCARELEDELSVRFGIEVPVTLWPPAAPNSPPPGRLLRISAQVYNTLEQLVYLASTLATLVQVGAA